MVRMCKCQVLMEHPVVGPATFRWHAVAVHHMPQKLFAHFQSFLNYTLLDTGEALHSFPEEEGKSPSTYLYHMAFEIEDGLPFDPGSHGGRLKVEQQTHLR